MNTYRAVHESPYGGTMTCRVIADSKSEAIRILATELSNNMEYYEIISIRKLDND